MGEPLPTLDGSTGPIVGDEPPQPKPHDPAKPRSRWSRLCDWIFEIDTVDDPERQQQRWW